MNAEELKNLGPLNRFLDREFQTVRYELTVTIYADDTFGYDEDTVLKMPGRPDVFHHRDKNLLRRVGQA
ncbi:MAG TPA: hypothetical protein VN646_25300 [Candidatus Acidoferrum sp.]|jgi:hypothetical protein|nr:hypothetical protein [Candidatus Acidoferrum sp.]